MTDTLLDVSGLVKHFPIKEGVLGRTAGAVRAVEDVSFAIPRGQTLSLVGESGSGKTTAARSILRLIEPTGGTILFDGLDVTAMNTADLRRLRRRAQIIFQDPYGSLNPRMTVFNMLAEAIRVHKLRPRQECRARVEELLRLVGLPPEAADRYPHEFSGGQRQRIGIARALAVEPDLIVADEPVSALDVSVQAQILNLLEELQQQLGLTYLFIGHDLRVVRHISDTVAVMYLGRIVEMGPAESVFNQPVHPYTKGLLAAVPVPDPTHRRKHALLAGDAPSPIAPPPGCAFHPRCPDAEGRCAQAVPSLVERSAAHCAACHVHAPSP